MAPEGWKTVRIGDIAQVKGGKRMPKGRPFAESKTPYPYIRVSDFDNGTVNAESLKYVLPDDREKIKSYTISYNDLYISIAGTIGLVGTVPMGLDGAQLTENAAKICLKSKTDVERDYIKYVLSSTIGKSQIDTAKGVGGGVPKLAIFRIEDINVPLPPFLEQEKITAILSSVDDTIQATQTIIDQTRRVKQGLLQQLLTRGIGHTRFKQTEIGEIPEEWDLTSLANLGQSDRPAIKAGPFGSALKKSFYVAHGYKVYGQEQVISGDFSIGNYYIDANHFEKLKTCAVHPGDILISLVGTFGKSVVAPHNIEPGIINPRLVRLALEPSLVEPFFIKEWLGCSDTQKQLKGVAHGGTMGILNAGTFKSLHLPLPPLHEQRQIMNVLKSFNETIEAEYAKLQQNIKIKKGLMQDLLTGRVRVKPDEVDTT